MNIYATELYKALEKSHPDLWQIKDYLGKDTMEIVVSPYLDENGNFDPNPLWAMLNPAITPAENLQKNVEEIWNALSSRTLEKWFAALTKEQAETICEVVEYFGTVTFCGISVHVNDFPHDWEKYHPGEGFLPIRDKWFDSIT